MRARGWFLDTRPLHGSRPFRDLWIGSAASQLGGQIADVAVLAQVWDLTGSPVGTGAIGFATGLPMVLFGLLGGTLADTVDRRTLVRATTAGQLSAAAGLCVQALAGNKSVVLLLALVATGASCSALGAPARRTFPVRLLPAGLLSGTVTRRRRSGLVQLVAAAWGLALAGFGLAGQLWTALACLAVGGAADTVSVVTRSALVQSETPDAYRGRISSVEHVIGVAGPELGNFRGGLLASATSASFSLVAGGLSAVLAIALVAVANAPLRACRTPSAVEEPTVPVVADAAKKAG